MAAADELTKVKDTLDQVTQEFFDTLESLYQGQAKLESLMRDGFLNMSRARYHMGGTRSIGALQFEKNELEMDALCVVNIYSEEEEDMLRDCDCTDNRWPEMEIKLVQKQLPKTHKVILKNSSVADENQANELRQRKKGAKDSDDDDAIESVSMQELSLKDKDGEVRVNGKKSSGDAPKLRDPLHLFGVLVSPHLRQCQASFKQAVAAAVQIANTKHKLQGLKLQFEQLHKQKESLLAK